jgi:hypothetical protein
VAGVSAKGRGCNGQRVGPRIRQGTAAAALSESAAAAVSARLIGTDRPMGRGRPHQQWTGGWKRSPHGAARSEGNSANGEVNSGPPSQQSQPAWNCPPQPDSW